MSIAPLLTLMGNLSIGLDEPSPSDTKIFLRFLNLAYEEILKETLSQNPFVTITSDLLDCNVGVCSVPSKTIFATKLVYDISRNIPLEGTTYNEVVQRDPNFSNTGSYPLSWYMSGGSIRVYPNITSLVADGGGIGIRYVAEPDPLTLNSFLSDIQIPQLYLNVLVDGACYYMFQSEIGFKDQYKMQTAMQRFLEGKRQLFAYLVRSGGKKSFSTYSPV